MILVTSLRIIGKGILIVQIGLDVTPPVPVEYTSAFREVDVLVRVRIVESLLLGDVSLVTVEGNTVKQRFRLFHLCRSIALSGRSLRLRRLGKLTYEVDGICPSVVPVVLVSNKQRVLETIVVHQGAQLLPHLAFPVGIYQGRRVGTGRILGLILPIRPC